MYSNLNLGNVINKQRCLFLRQCNFWFIDIATKDEIEKYMYGGKTSTAYFVRETRKATWFTQVPVSLTRANGSANFGSEWSASISRAGDYLLYTWLRVRIPSVTLLTTNQFGANGRIRWCRNFMHNLIRECSYYV